MPPMYEAAAGHRRRDVVVLGSTGSIGTQALEVVEQHPDRFRVVALAAGGGRPELLAAQALAHRVPVVALSRGSAAQDVQLALYAEAQRRGYATGDAVLPRLVVGSEAAAEVAALPADVVLNGMTGAVGLMPTLAALDAGTMLALANKESLIVGGPVVKERAAPGQVVPVDSEHSAIAQALRGESPDDVARLVVTATGGPFRGRRRSELEDVTPEQAMAHPRWEMGPVISINSATLMNKGLEVIEAHLLFDVPMDRIEVVVHPGAYVHSMVELVDGSTMLQASPPDMRLPIALGLAWPERVPGVGTPFDWSAPEHWEFHALDEEAFPAVSLARRAGAAGGCAPAVLNAANEECVQRFRDGGLRFTGIVDTVAAVLGDYLGASATGQDVPSSGDRIGVDDVLAADAWARDHTRAVLDGGPSRPD